MRRLLNRSFFLVIIFFCSPAYSSNLEEGIQALKDKQYTTALQKLTPYAKKGYAKAQFFVGSIYLNGYGVAQNYEVGIEWITLAAEQDEVDAQFLLGIVYENGDESFQDHRNAVKWYKRATEQGHSTASLFLASMYERGAGIQQNYSRAYMFLLVALDLDNYKAGKKLKKLKEKMTASQLHAARDMADAWIEKYNDN